MADAGKSFGFSLSTRLLKPVVFQGPGGLGRKGDGAMESSHYYSFTRMATTSTVRYLKPGEWRLNATGQWTSPATGTPYPAGWTLDIPDVAIHAVITPRLADQENRSALIPNLFYWEGAIRVESSSSGQRMRQGYVELTGYGENSRPPM